MKTPGSLNNAALCMEDTSEEVRAFTVLICDKNPREMNDKRVITNTVSSKADQILAQLEVEP